MSNNDAPSIDPAQEYPDSMTVDEFVKKIFPASSNGKHMRIINQLKTDGWEDVGEIRLHNFLPKANLPIMVTEQIYKALGELSSMQSFKSIANVTVEQLQLLDQACGGTLVNWSALAVRNRSDQQNKSTTPPMTASFDSTTSNTSVNMHDPEKYESMPASSAQIEQNTNTETMQIQPYSDMTNTSFFITSKFSGDIYKSETGEIRVSSCELKRMNNVTKESNTFSCVVKRITHETNVKSPELQKLDKVISRGQSFINKSRPDIVKLYGYLHTTSMDYLVMERMKCSLSHLLHSDKDTLTFMQRLDICLKCFNAVLCLHDDGIVHRDIKPANFLVHNDNSRVCLSDFGTIRILSSAEQTRTSITVIGTQGYIAPEMFESNNPERFLDKNALISDIYSLGVLLGEVIWLVKPFSHIQKPDYENNYPFDYEVYSGWTDPALLDLIRSMTNKNPQNRPSLSKCKHTLDDIAREHSIHVRVHASNHFLKYHGSHLVNQKKLYPLNKILFDFDEKFISSRVWLRINVRYRLMKMCLKCIMFMHQHHYSVQELKLSDFYANHQLTLVYYFGPMIPLTEDKAEETRANTIFNLGTIMAEIWFHTEPSHVDVLPYTSEIMETTVKEYQSFFKACWALGRCSCEQLVQQLAACPVNYPTEYTLRLSSLVTLEGPIIVGGIFFADISKQFTTIEMKHLPWILRWNYSFWRNLMHLWNTPERQEIIYHIICHCENGAAMHFLAQHYEHGLAPFPKDEERMMNLLCRGWVIKYDASVRKFEKLIRTEKHSTYLQTQYEKHINLQYAHPFSKLFLAVCMFYGKVVTSSDIPKAVGIFTDLSSAGYVFAQFWLAYCLNNGFGVEKSPEKAAQILNVAVEEYASSNPAIAEHYYHGIGVAKDVGKARKYIEQAVRYNCDSAFVTMGQWLEEEGKSNEAEVLYKQADAQDHPEAAKLLSKLCESQARSNDYMFWQNRMEELCPGSKTTPKLKTLLQGISLKRALDDTSSEQPTKKQKLE